MRATSCPLLASPRPVPPYLRESEVSACTNGWKMTARGGTSSTGAFTWARTPSRTLASIGSAAGTAKSDKEASGGECHRGPHGVGLTRSWPAIDRHAQPRTWGRSPCCLLYTSDAADDLLCVDLGGRRIIKK